MTRSDLIDSHAHLLHQGLKDNIEGVLSRAQAEGVTHIIHVGTGEHDKENQEVLACAQKYPNVFATIGWHPHEASRFREDLIKDLENLAQEKKIVAIGEVGLDYYYDHSPRESQERVLRTMVQLARRAKLPLIIHCREAFEDLERILEEEKGFDCGGVLHCYTGDFATAERFLKKGFFISFSGIVTFKKATEVQASASQVPLDRLLIETDCPFLAPEPHRGQTNEPANVRLVAEKIAFLRRIAFEEVAEATRKNAIRLFRLPLPLS